MIHIDLKTNTPDYEALSYVWSNSSPPTLLGRKRERFRKFKESIYLDINHEATPEGLPVLDMTFEELKASNVPWRKGVYYGLGGKLPNGYLMCDGQKMVIGGKLQAMRRLREKNRERLVWIDALCINQNDIEERNEHVKKMGEIYLKASKVLI
jgi:hypothetical protein